MRQPTDDRREDNVRYNLESERRAEYGGGVPS
jgi:hypothetical protein